MHCTAQLTGPWLAHARRILDLEEETLGKAYRRDQVEWSNRGPRMTCEPAGRRLRGEVMTHMEGETKLFGEMGTGVPKELLISGFEPRFPRTVSANPVLQLIR